MGRFRGCVCDKAVNNLLRTPPPPSTSLITSHESLFEMCSDDRPFDGVTHIAHSVRQVDVSPHPPLD